MRKKGRDGTELKKVSCGQIARDERSTCTNFWATIARICDYYGSCKSHRLVSPFKRHTIGVRTYTLVHYVASLATVAQVT